MKNPVILLVTKAAWESELREQFTEEEKAALRKAIANEVLCPPGHYINADRLTPALAEKLRQALVARAQKRLANGER